MQAALNLLVRHRAPTELVPERVMDFLNVMQEAGSFFDGVPGEGCPEAKNTLVKAR